VEPKSPDIAPPPDEPPDAEPPPRHAPRKAPTEYRPDLRPILLLAGTLLLVVVGWIVLSPVILPPTVR
jgi:hypothetical protein